MMNCSSCGKRFSKRRVYNQHLSISHKKEWNRLVERWEKMYDSGTPARRIAEQYKVNILTVYKYLKKLKKAKGTLPLRL